MNLKTSIIVGSYNQASTLRLLFESLERQTIQNFEVVVADDGSSDNTEALCKLPRPFPIQFVTQADEGFRKSKILNEAIRRAKSDYLIFVDGDVILEKHFIEDHLRLRKSDHFVCGRRVDLGPEFSKTLSVKAVQDGAFDKVNFSLILSRLKKDSENVNRSMRVTNYFIRKIFKYDRPLDILGSNFGAWKADILAINGFNEDFVSYYREDGDLFIRLRNIGKKSIGAKALCVQFHIFHSRREPDQKNDELYLKLLKDKNYVWAENGLKKEPR